jgi:hypothetical protein
MASDPDAIQAALANLLRPQARNRLLARGLARGMVWRDGIVPEGGPTFHESLTPDLLDFGYGVIALALALRDANRDRHDLKPFDTSEPFRVGAEALESAIRRGDPANQDQGRHLVVCSAAFHLAGFAARSFSVLPRPVLDKNLSPPERALGLLLRRDLVALRDHVVGWLGDVKNRDDAIANRLADVADDFGPPEAALLVLTTAYHRALGLADTALLTGSSQRLDKSLGILNEVVAATGNLGNIPLWWVATLTSHLVRDLWDSSLHVRLPRGPRSDLPASWSKLRRRFIDQLAARRPPHIDLWPSQLSAAERAIDPSDDLVISLPTSSGKTRIAELCILRALADSKRAVYVTPLRALSAQVEGVLARTFVPLGANVTSLYGASGATMIDTQTLGSAEVVVATPEKLDFALRQDPSVIDDVALIVFDEGHMIGLGSREIRYEALIQRLLRRPDANARRIVCLSAMFNSEDPYFADFGNWLRSDEPGESVHVKWRPTRQRLATLNWSESTEAARLSFIEDDQAFVPRFFESKPAKGKRYNPFPQSDIEFCIASANAFARDGHNILVYSPQRSQIEPLVREFLKIQKQGYLDALKAPAPTSLKMALAIGREWLGAEHPAVLGLEIGVGTHHGALPRPFLNAVEQLLNDRKLPVVVASPTLAQGIDLACSVLIFRSIRRFDPDTKRPVSISAAEFANVLGRAGRAYVDLDGIAVLPSFDVSNRTAQQRMFEKLLKDSRESRLVSGIAQLVLELVVLISEKLGVARSAFAEYVLNHPDFWADPRLAETQTEEDDDQIVRTVAEQLADLDVALLSLFENLDTPVETLAETLDEVLKDSLWKRTLAHEDAGMQQLQRGLLVSRAEWVWRSTTLKQRAACYSAGLGRDPGVFLYENLDQLVGLLIDFNRAIAQADGAAAGAAAILFANEVFRHPFFAVRTPPDKWEEVLRQWIEGVPFGVILKGRAVRDMQRTQAFVQDGVVFRLVWAAEAVRVQAVAIEHARADELGDGPAYALTYGVPSIPAGVLCQGSLASRGAAIKATSDLLASFTDLAGMRQWLRENRATLAGVEFWESEDLRLLWTTLQPLQTGEQPREWTRRTFVLTPKWMDGLAPKRPRRLRILARTDRTAIICALDLTPLGTVKLPVDSSPGAFGARFREDGSFVVSYFGPQSAGST